MANNSGSARWQGDLKTGTGTVSTQSGVLSEQSYSFATRFGDEPGTNPEELIAAAHAACFSMALSKGLADAGVTDAVIETTAAVTLAQKDGGFAITRSALKSNVKGNGDEAVIREAAAQAEKNCPVSKVLNAEISLDLTVG